MRGGEETKLIGIKKTYWSLYFILRNTCRFSFLDTKGVDKQRTGEWRLTSRTVCSWRERKGREEE